MDAAPTTLTVALWALNLARPVTGIQAWAAAVEARMAEAQTEGVDLLVMPEHAAAQWLSFAPPDLAFHQEIAWLAGHTEAALEALQPLPARYGMALLAGTLPVKASGPCYLNRAHLLLPDGRIVAQDKLCTTPTERDPAGWNLTTGSRLSIVRWRGLRLAVLICLDIELPALAVRLASYDLDLILVPSLTRRLSGYRRVFGCAKARAVELEVAVCAVGCIGRASPDPMRPCYVSGAGAFLPCEEALGDTGVAAELPPQDNAEGPGPLLFARDLPIGKIRELRHGGAEVWPGAWNADHVSIVEAEEDNPL